MTKTPPRWCNIRTAGRGAMKYHNGVWSYKGKTYHSLHEALVANWPK